MHYDPPKRREIRGVTASNSQRMEPLNENKFNGNLVIGFLHCFMDGNGWTRHYQQIFPVDTATPIRTEPSNAWHCRTHVNIIFPSQTERGGSRLFCYTSDYWFTESSTCLPSPQNGDTTDGSVHQNDSTAVYPSIRSTKTTSYVQNMSVRPYQQLKSSREKSVRISK
jgi:hypothetical protein